MLFPKIYKFKILREHQRTLQKQEINFRPQIFQSLSHAIKAREYLRPVSNVELLHMYRKANSLFGSCEVRRLNYDWRSLLKFEHRVFLLFLAGPNEFGTGFIFSFLNDISFTGKWLILDWERKRRPNMGLFVLLFCTFPIMGKSWLVSPLFEIIVV